MKILAPLYINGVHLGTAADKLPYCTALDVWAETPLTTFGRSLIDDADATAGRTTLGLGTAAVKNTGTSGTTVPLLDGTNAWSGANTYPANNFGLAYNSSHALYLNTSGAGSFDRILTIGVGGADRALVFSADATIGGTNTGDQTSIVGITGTIAQFNTACTDADFAPIASPALTGTPTAPTASGGTNTTQIATTAFVTSAVATAVIGLLEFQGSTDCSTNPNYPAASKGDLYIVTVAGKIGGASGLSVDVGDAYFATADNAGGTQASVGTSWDLLEHNLVGALLTANNLSDLTSASTARTNLGLGTLATQSGTFSGTSSGTNTGDQTSIVGITGTKAQFNTAVTDGDIVYLDSVDAITGVKTMSGLNVILVSSSGLTIRNPANTFKYTITGAAILADRILTLPLTAGTVALTSDITGTNSGTNTGDQTITLTGDVTGSGTGSFAATIAAAAVTLAKMANMATSSLFYRKTAGSGAPEVNTLATLQADLLQPVRISTVNASASATIDITGITGYAGYEIRINNVVPATDDVSMWMRVSTDGGSTYKATLTDYGWVVTAVTPGGVTVLDNNAASGQINLNYLTSTSGKLGNAAGEHSSFVIRLPGMAVAGLKQHFFWDGAVFASASAGITKTSGAGCYNTAGAINAIRFLMSSGNITSGTFELWGIP